MRISDWSSDVCSSDLVAQPGCHREEQSEERQQRGTAAGKIAVQRPQETLRHRLALGSEICDLSRHYVPPDLLLWGSLGATLRRIPYRGGSRMSRQTTGKTDFYQDFTSTPSDRPTKLQRPPRR